MLTIFAVPKPFLGHINTIQRNAIRSWTLLEPRPEILLIGDEEGTAEICNELGLLQHAEVRTNEFGTPMVSSVFEIAQTCGHGDLMMYTNCDIIFMNDLTTALSRIDLARFLMVGRRWNFSVYNSIDFGNPNWAINLERQVRQFGVMAARVAIDYFAFPRNQYSELKPLLIGRKGWDGWFIYHTRSAKIPVIDATPSILAIHQNHDYSHLEGGISEYAYGEEAEYNLELIGTWENSMNLSHATNLLSEKGITDLPPTFWNILASVQSWAVLDSPNHPFARFFRWVINPHGRIKTILREMRAVLKNKVERIIGS